MQQYTAAVVHIKTQCKASCIEQVRTFAALPEVASSLCIPYNYTPHHKQKQHTEACESMTLFTEVSPTAARLDGNSPWSARRTRHDGLPLSELGIGYATDKCLVRL